MIGWILGGLSTLGVAGMIIAAIFVPCASEVMAGIGRAFGSFLAKVPPWVYAALALIALIAFLVISRGDYMREAHAAEALNVQYCEAVRAADSNPRLDCGQALKQIGLMGTALEQATAELKSQSDAINNLAAASAKQQQIAAEAEKAALQRAEDAEAVAQQFEAESRSVATGGGSGGQCEVSPALQEQWP